MYDQWSMGLGLSDRLVRVVCTPLFTAPFCLLIGSDDFSSFFFLGTEVSWIIKHSGKYGIYAQGLWGGK